MAQTTLPVTHRVAPRRRRAFFGLLDADGWAWAGLKAAFWFIVIIILLGYIPDRAYYFTVQRTIDVGLLAWSPVNLCPPENETLPCPAPVGASLPWHPAPAELQLPAGRTDGAAVALGSTYLYIGGSDGKAATNTVFVAKSVGTGNFDKWTQGPALPDARTDAAVVAIGTTVYVIGGADAKGAPTTTAYSLTVGADGTLGQWKTDDALALPEGRTGAAAVALSDGIALLGGANAGGPTSTVWKSQQNAQGALQTWKPQQPMLEENVDGGGVHVGDVVFVIGGRNRSGPVATVQQGLIGGPNATATDPNVVTAWRASAQTNLPGRLANPAVFAVNGTIYVAGGNTGDGSRPEVLWAAPDAGGVIDSWKHLSQTDLGQGIEGASAFTAGSHAFILGGRTSDGVTAGAARADLAPQQPFFQLGILGATIPALKLEGEVGQQLGYLNAATVGAVDFILLILVGWAFAHRDRVAEMLRRRRR